MVARHGRTGPEIMKFWKGRKVLVTGHTGFKGSWLSEILLLRGARVAGFALPPDTNPSLFEQLELAQRVDHSLGDIRNVSLIHDFVKRTQPEIIFHLAAQPLVRRSYREPLETWSSNVMGTAHLLEAVRILNLNCAVVIVTTDKVYENQEWEHPYREIDPLGGHDPYSASKAGTEMVAKSYRQSYFSGSAVKVATARAGNVIGGGDWSEDRIIPDLARAFSKGQQLIIRNNRSVRPWQHVLDPLLGYLKLAELLSGPESSLFEDAFNFGPEPADMRTVGELVETASKHWPGDSIDKTDVSAPHEAGQLSLSIERARRVIRWRPRWGFERAVMETICWYRDVNNGADPATLIRSQIKKYSENS